VVGFIKGKSAIHLARTYGEHKQNFAGQHFWARGYFVSTEPVPEIRTLG
jgi:putative transposase